jgi:hypothetical protein
MKKTRKSFGLLGIFLVLEMGCAAGRHHTSDSRLEQNFFRNQSKFQTLLVDVMADEKLRMIGRVERFATVIVRFSMLRVLRTSSALD